MFTLSSNVDGAALEFLDTYALPTFAAKSKDIPGLFQTFFGIFFDSLSPILPRLLKRAPKPSTKIVLSLTLIELFLHIEQGPANKLF